MINEQVVSLEYQGDIATITINNPPVNTLAKPVRIGLLTAVADIVRDGRAIAVVLISEGRTFSAGGEITEFGSSDMEPDANELFKALEDMPIPVVAAIHGSALGGGLECAMSCHFRCASVTAKVGLPEVGLGLLPGAGGTQRLPRLVGVKQSLDMMVFGTIVSASEALKMGVIDHIVEGDLLEGALAYASQLLSLGRGVRRTKDLQLSADNLTSEFFRDYRQSIIDKTRGLFSPAKIVESVEAALEGNFAQGLKRERELFTECFESVESIALRHVFFAQRQTDKVPDIHPSTSARDINNIAVIGAGALGRHFAICFVDAGIPVILVDVDSDGIGNGLELIRKHYQAKIELGRLTQQQLQQRMSLLSCKNDYRDLNSADLIIEAASEDLVLTRSIFTRLGEVCKAGVIFAALSSTLDLDDIGALSARAGDILGLHFPSVKGGRNVLEVVRTENTSDEVLLTVLRLLKKIRKIAIVASANHGFIGDRMLAAYLDEVSVLISAGAPPMQVNQALLDFGMTMMPVCVDGELTGPDVISPKPLKGLAGISHSSIDALSHTDLNRAVARQRNISDEEIVLRCLYRLAQEGSRILAEGKALRAGDIDVLWVNGFGFPAYRGGPMHFAEGYGLSNMSQAITGFDTVLNS